jgi:membrane protease YdiL (CAAX protease family)
MGVRVTNATVGVVGKDGSGKEERDPRGRIGVWTVIAAFAVYLLVQTVGILAVLAATGAFDDRGGIEAALEGPGVVLAGVASTGVAAMAGAALAAAVGGRGFRALGLRRASLRWLLVGLGVGIGAMLVNRVVVLLYVWATGDASNPQAGFAETADGTLAQFALMVLLGGLFVPFAEELLFRGVLYGWLRRWGVVVATAASAVVFGLFHLAPVLLIPTILIGAVNAVLYERSGSIWPAVAAHAANNVVLFMIARALL